MKAMAAIALGLSLLATPAFAYIGPGAGITVLGALWGLVVAVVLALAAVLLRPLRALFRRRRRAARSGRRLCLCRARGRCPFLRALRESGRRTRRPAAGVGSGSGHLVRAMRMAER